MWDLEYFVRLLNSATQEALTRGYSLLLSPPINEAEAWRQLRVDAPYWSTQSRTTPCSLSSSGAARPSSPGDATHADPMGSAWTMTSKAPRTGCSSISTSEAPSVWRY